MKVCVAGLWHFGPVTAACLAAAGHDVVGLDFDADVVAGLAWGRPPVFEPGLEELVKAGLASGRLSFTVDPLAAIPRADVIWIAYDTPVDEEDRADVEYVTSRIDRVLPHVPDGALTLISSQVPVGTTAQVEQAFARQAGARHASFGYSPENLRLGKAIEAFTRPDRVVIGVRGEGGREKAIELFRAITDRLEWMSVESAEMTKHAINAFLAASVTFINEIASLCEQVGADAAEVERGLKTEARIGPRAYLAPGAAFAGGTLARDVMFLAALGETKGVPTHLLSSIKPSNDAHRAWVQRRLTQLLGGLEGRTIAVWGLTYKPGTDTLRRSSALELCGWLSARGAHVRAHDPAVRALPSGQLRVYLADTPMDASENADALVVATPWPDYRNVDPGDVLPRMARPLVLDAGRFLAPSFGAARGVEYISVGRAGR